MLYFVIVLYNPIVAVEAIFTIIWGGGGETPVPLPTLYETLNGIALTSE